ncbi:MAG: PASTA domain-containing protein, partial [Muribaculaceae bacterium]|nr:PASTA domain-containing protein [Muribaculaceae bacterium]
LYGVPGEQKQIQLTNKFVSAPITPAINGYDITTTINVALQDIVETELYNMCHETDARWGCAILMEVATGEIKAISNLQWNEHQQDYVEGVNHAVLGYEPGSVMKPITMMMALEDGNELVQNIDSPIATGTSFSYGGRVVTDPHGGAFLTPREIIATSSNVGMSKIVLKKYESNPGRFRDRLAEMGFFDPFHSGIGGERQPIVARLGNKVWDKVALTRMAFGYSTEIPPLYTLAMYNAIANDGRFVRPRLVKKLSRAGEPDSIIPVTYIREHVCSPENAAKLRIMLHDVVWSNRGTAHRYLQDPHVDIAGKTGTAYTIENGQYTSQRRLAFCGFFPYDKPRYSCIVLMKGANRGAAASSGMVLKNVALKMYAKGMLGDAPSYASGEQVAPEKGRTAVVHASMNSNLTTNLRRGLNQSKIKAYQRPQQGEGVPNVRGMGVREAIARLEQAGMAVKFSGTGYVVAQTPAAGSKYAIGQTVELKLQN